MYYIFYQKCYKFCFQLKKEYQEEKKVAKSILLAKLDSTLHDFFKCPICFDYVIPTPLCCINGHIVCVECARACHMICSQCKEWSTIAANENISELANQCLFACNNAGCTEVLPFDVYKTHRTGCKFDPDLQRPRKTDTSAIPQVLPIIIHESHHSDYDMIHELSVLQFRTPYENRPVVVLDLPVLATGNRRRFENIIPAGAEQDAEVVGSSRRRRR